MRLERGVEIPTSKGKLWRGIAAGLVVADQAQDLAEARRRQQAAVLRVCNLPYLAQDGGSQFGALEELDGDFARDDAQFLGICLLEQILEGTLLVGGQVEDGVVCNQNKLSAGDATAASGIMDILSSPLAERSAMAAGGQAMELVDGMGSMQ